MYICICKAVTESQLDSAISQGMCSRRQLFECLGAGSQCGKCGPLIREKIKKQMKPKPVLCSNDELLA